MHALVVVVVIIIVVIVIIVVVIIVIVVVVARGERSNRKIVKYLVHHFIKLVSCILKFLT